MTEDFPRVPSARCSPHRPRPLLLNLLLLWLLGRLKLPDPARFLGVLCKYRSLQLSCSLIPHPPQEPQAYAMMAILVACFRGADLRAPLALIAVNVGYTFPANVSLGAIWEVDHRRIVNLADRESTSHKTQWSIALRFGSGNCDSPGDPCISDQHDWELISYTEAPSVGGGAFPVI